MILFWFFLAHWYLSLFCQTFFLHRYASHQMFTMKPFTERCFHFLTFLFQGSSYLNPRAYAIMHRMHHAYSDTEKDPHSPHVFKDIWRLMVETARFYRALVHHERIVDSKFEKGYPIWKTLDAFGDKIWVRILFALVYMLFYGYCCSVLHVSWFWCFLLPVHFLMGPVQGALVNWCGHKYGYRNFETNDQSRNTFWLNLLLLGEIKQNNHHKHPSNPNFACRWFEIDPVWPVIWLFNSMRLLRLRPAYA